MKLKKQSREISLDIARALGIIFIVYGHSGLPGTWVLYTFHVPLFFMVSGYIFNGDSNVSFKLFFAKKIKELYFPFLLYGVAFVFLHNFFIRIGLLSVQDSIFNHIYLGGEYINILFQNIAFNGTEILLAPLWFVTILFITNILFYFILKLSNKFIIVKSKYNSPLLVMPIVFILYVFFKHFFFKINFNFTTLDVAFTSLIFFSFGYFFKVFEFVKKINIYVIFFAFLFFVGIIAFGRFDVDLRINKYPHVVGLIVTSICGFLITLYVSLNIAKSTFFLKTILLYVGRNTFFIMAIHLLCFKLVTFTQVLLYKMPLDTLGKYELASNGQYWKLIYFLTGLFVPIFVLLTYEWVENRVKVLYSK